MDRMKKVLSCSSYNPAVNSLSVSVPTPGPNDAVLSKQVVTALEKMKCNLILFIL